MDEEEAGIVLEVVGDCLSYSVLVSTIPVSDGLLVECGSSVCVDGAGCLGQPYMAFIRTTLHLANHFAFWLLGFFDC